jgi:serine O-acetyltransferase
MSTQSNLVDSLLASYAKCGGINHLDGVNLPSKAVVAELAHDLLSLLFPGFFCDAPVVASDLPALTSRLSGDLRQRLLKEVSKSLEFQPVPDKKPVAIVDHFFERLLVVRNLLQTDVQAALDGDPAAASKEEIILSYPGLEAIAIQRMAHILERQGVALIPRIMTEWAHARTGIDIHPGAQIGSHFFIDHGTGVVIGQTTVIGSRVRIYQGVTLGGKSLASKTPRDDHGHAIGGKRHPTIGDDVTIYANATILGGDTTIGNRSIIGGNVWLTQSVPPDSIVTFESQQLNIRSRSPKSTLTWDI